jgi:hypothetical protein
MRYRYRNLVLRGNWFGKREDAIDDALRAGQVRRTGEGLLEWVDHGSLEEDIGDISEIVRPAS